MDINSFAEAFRPLTDEIYDDIRKAVAIAVEPLQKRIAELEQRVAELEATPVSAPEPGQ